MTSLKNISIRMPEKILENIDKLVEDGIYANRTEALRDAARLLIRNQIGMIPGKRPIISKDEIWEAIVEDIDS
jgi:Arc/MetJ-type ribon-helix-helix transcriptional regulator